MLQGELERGDVVQLNPDTVENRAFRGKLMTVSEVRSWGAQGYVENISLPPDIEGAAKELGIDVEKLRDALGHPGVVTYNNRAYYRARWEDMEYVGRSVWELAEEEHEGKEDGPEESGATRPVAEGEDRKPGGTG